MKELAAEATARVFGADIAPIPLAKNVEPRFCGMCRPIAGRYQRPHGPCGTIGCECGCIPKVEGEAFRAWEVAPAYSALAKDLRIAEQAANIFHEAVRTTEGAGVIEAITQSGNNADPFFALLTEDL